MDDYNGWTNKATWLVKLWIDNDQGLQEHWLEMARDSVTEYQLADTLKEEFTDTQSSILGTQYSASFWDDLMSWALAMVNWDEVAHSLMEDAEEVA